METNKWVVLQKCPSKSILVWVGVAALSSITVTTAGTLRVIKRNFHRTDPIIWRAKAAISTLTVTTVPYLHHGKDNTPDERKASDDRTGDDGRQVALDLTVMSGGRRLRNGTQINVLGRTSLLCRHPQRHRRFCRFRR